jgi:hypothetical protein
MQPGADDTVCDPTAGTTALDQFTAIAGELKE